MPWKMAAALTYTEPLVQGMGMGREVHERTKGAPGRRSPEKSNLKTMPMIKRTAPAVFAREQERRSTLSLSTTRLYPLFIFLMKSSWTWFMV